MRALQAVMLSSLGRSSLLDLLGGIHFTVGAVTGWDRLYKIFLPERCWALRIAARLRGRSAKTVTFELPSGSIYRVTDTGVDRVA